MKSEDVLGLYNALEKIGIHVWVDGGWATDALLGGQTRPHQDMDIAIQQKDVVKFRELLTARGYQEIKLEIAKPHNFVLGDNKGREIDVHVIVLDNKGNGIYGPAENGEMFPASSLTGSGTITGQEVKCISAEYMVRFLAPWISKHPHKYLEAVSLLCQKFGIELPEEYTNYKNA